MSKLNEKETFEKELSKIDLFKLLKPNCRLCNFIKCICPTQKSLKKNISTIKEEQVKSRKWVTLVYGDVDNDTLQILRKNLGTGGTLIKDHLRMQGKIKSRVKATLLKHKYTIL